MNSKLKTSDIVAVALITGIGGFLSTAYRSELIAFLNSLIEKGLYIYSIPAFLITPLFILLYAEIPKGRRLFTALVILAEWAALPVFFILLEYNNQTYMKACCFIAAINVATIVFIRERLTRSSKQALPASGQSEIAP